MNPAEVRGARGGGARRGSARHGVRPRRARADAALAPGGRLPRGRGSRATRSRPGGAPGWGEPPGGLLSAVSFLGHDFILASLARETLERARADAARRPLVREARRANRRESPAIPRIAAGSSLT